ncbi:MAG: hypothetical protein LBK60_02550 [Verrucomicrobiales bacterium]|jgi:hypothetical protein|nr:hypothetical protein [Verrucomicrobiales bacterium]
MRFLICLSLTVTSCLAQVPAWNQATVSGWWQKYPTPETWGAAGDELRSQLAGTYEQREAGALTDSGFQSWLRHWQWVGLGMAAGDWLKNDADREVFVALGKDARAAHLFAAKISPANQSRKALNILLRLAREQPDDLREYAALGVALALVFDKPFPKNWPHHQVSRKLVPIGDDDVVARFRFYVEANRKNKLAQDISKLEFDEVKFVVDSLVSLDELRYGQSNKSSRVNYTNFDQAFPAIQYDEARVGSGRQQYNWPEKNGAYTLQNIERLGGICTDQAYYAATLGKARGIPTLYFHGQGTGGGHAWFGFLQRNGKWNLDCGRYVSQNYPVGDAYDPQTWRVLKDALLLTLARNVSHDEKYAAARTGLAWAAANAGGEREPQILWDTLTVMPELAETWEALGDWLDQHEPDAGVRREFYEAWVKQFSANRDWVDLKVDGQKRLLALLKQTGDPSAAQLQRDIMMYNRKKRFDLGISAGASVLFEKLEGKDWQGARVEYERVVRTFNQQGGGNLYYQIVRPYVQYCLEEKQAAQARQGLKYARGRMRLPPDSILAEEFERLDKAIQSAASAGGE